MTLVAALIEALPSFSTTWLLLIIGISTIATSTIGIDAMDKNPDYKAEHGASDMYLIFNLVIAIIAILVAVLGMMHYFGVF